MAQESPSRLLYAQAIQSIKQLVNEYSTKTEKDSNEISVAINKLLTNFMEKAGYTLAEFEEIERSEAPNSAKMNKFWTTLENDVNILQDQVDLLAASSIAAHNFIKTDLLKAKGENLQLQNKLKTLQLFSSVDNDSLIYFGDSFITEDFIDWDLVSSDQATVRNGAITLRVVNSESLYDANTVVRVLNNSNGFIGNNQEILDPQSALTDILTNQKLYQFVSDFNRAADLKKMLDSKPNTWVEFEKYLISAEDRAKAKNFNFEYILSDDSSVTYLKTSTDSAITEKTNGSLISWADGISSGALRFYIEIDFQTIKQINDVVLTPYGLTDNINNPILIKKVSISSDRTNWTVLSPENVWIANGIDKKVVSIDKDSIAVGSTAWTCSGQNIRYVRFEIEQPTPIDCNIGHIYYLEKDSPAANVPNTGPSVVTSTSDSDYESDLRYDSPLLYGGTAPSVNNYFGSITNEVSSGSGQMSQGSMNTAAVDASYRVLGPNPSVLTPNQYNPPATTQSNGLLQKREYFVGKRWAIGIRDIEISKKNYGVIGTIVSKRFDIPGIVDRVSIEADIFIPEDYDSSEIWIRFYVSPDDGLTWYQISRIQDNISGIPEIIAFNDPTPIDLREPGVGYYNTSSKASSLRVKVEISRPSEANTSTPIVYSYKLKVVKRDSI